MKPFYRRRSQGPARRSQQLTARATLCRFYIGYSSLPSWICLPRGKPIPGCGWVELNIEGGAVWGANQTSSRVRIKSGSRPEPGVRESQGPGGTFSLLSSGRRARTV